MEVTILLFLGRNVEKTNLFRAHCSHMALLDDGDFNSTQCSIRVFPYTGFFSRYV